MRPLFHHPAFLYKRTERKSNTDEKCKQHIKKLWKPYSGAAKHPKDELPAAL
jgi:hypothetical protein